MKRCHGGAELVAPAMLLAIAPAVPIVSETRTVHVVEHVVMPLPEDRPIAIEKPPF
jgi:hypothetical protein